MAKNKKQKLYLVEGYNSIVAVNPEPSTSVVVAPSRKEAQKILSSILNLKVLRVQRVKIKDTPSRVLGIIKKVEI